MIVTVTTDASFSRKHNVGTYAFWIKCNEFKITKHGPLRKSVKRPEIAEFQCIINALHTVFTTETQTPIKKIIVNTDCLNVINIVNQHRCKEAKFNCKRYNLNKWGHEMHVTYQRLLRTNKQRWDIVEFRHVKSHEHTNTSRNWVNQWCDDMAKFEINNLLVTLNSAQ
jgi:hypothetical protein